MTTVMCCYSLFAIINFLRSRYITSMRYEKFWTDANTCAEWKTGEKKCNLLIFYGIHLHKKINRLLKCSKVREWVSSSSVCKHWFLTFWVLYGVQFYLCIVKFEARLSNQSCGIEFPSVIEIRGCHQPSWTNLCFVAMKFKVPPCECTFPFQISLILSPFFLLQFSQE